MAFTTYDSIIAALAGGLGQRVQIQKSSWTTVAGGIYDYFTAPGWGAMQNDTFGTPLTARVMNNASAAAVPITNASSGRGLYLLSVGALSTVVLGTLVIYDRLAEYPLNSTVTSGSFTSVTLPARDAAGGTAGLGVLPFVENYSTSGAVTAQTLNLTYTNSGGTGSRTTGAITLTAVAANVNRVCQNQLWFPIAAGDTGVQSIQSYTLGASATSTQVNIVLARPLCYVPVMIANGWVERDLVLQLANLPRLWDGTCMGALLIANTTSSPLQAQVVMAEG